MRHPWPLLVVLILAGGALYAAPSPTSAPASSADPKAMQEEARRFAQQIAFVVERIAAEYVRPIAREALLEAAVAGIYRAASRRPPRDLRTEIRQAVSLSSVLRAEAQAANSNLRPVASGRPTDPVERLLAQFRVDLGDADLGGDSVVVACREIAKKLDPYSGLVTPEEQRRARPGSIKRTLA